MSSYEKYLKYKKKYIDLRDSRQNLNFSGGNLDWNKRNELRVNEFKRNNLGLNEFEGELRNQRTKKMFGGENIIFPIEDEIWFWGRQMTEHAFILKLGLEDENYKLKREADEIYRKWLRFMNETFWKNNTNLGNHNKFDLTKEEVESLKGKINMDELNNLLTEITNFKKKVVSELNTNEWKGWIYPSLAAHILKEAEYFARKISNKPMTAQEELLYINLHHMEEIGTTAQLIDPAPENTAIIDKARAYATKRLEGVGDKHKWTAEEVRILQGLNADEQKSFLALSIIYSKELTEMAEETGQKIDKKQLKSIISPFLAHHVHREFARFTKTLENLNV